MPKRPRHSRWSRLPATFRSGEKPISTPDEEPQRLTLYLPGRLLDLAQAQAQAAGVESVQEYCEALLTQILEARDESPRLARPEEGRRRVMDGLDEIVNDPEYLVAWSSSARPGPGAEGRTTGDAHSDGRAVAATAALAAGPIAEAEDEVDGPAAGDEGVVFESAALVVFRHAGLAGGEADEGLLPSLRRGEPIAPGPAQDLLQALIDLERDHRDAQMIDRRLAFALHRLAFEGQLLLTEAWPGVTPDTATIETLRLVQEAVDRVLSGEDIRYYREGEPAPESATEDY